MTIGVLGLVTSHFRRLGSAFALVMAVYQVTVYYGIDFHKCGPFLTSSTEDFNFYRFVSRVKDMNKTFHDTSVGQICVHYFDDEDCYVNLEEAGMGKLFRCARDVPGRESMFKPRSGILPRYRRRERI